ncbi:DUF4278 domain-containing protein [Candidatus Synechococcus calcipolaris G9]|uniref:DUF4278 domain-containing protein n=1 Tax=Candidatus Synechococcus calcipolaris G9 TaxID=1497997 RepID=A0ABT6F1I2_9SYNE|nr:DUF4278 domain-containing protein [Candidatus Synechococcus calcipolaris]MDG2991694.1 DUF4278 domain-containing protein [Candidatus Synechococcus calcipolaris G9]
MMKLTYRGTHYDYIPPALTTQATDVVAKYRGWEYRCTKVVNPPAQPEKDLTYRGVEYHTGEATAPVRPVAAVSSVTESPVDMPATQPNVTAMSRSLMMAHHQMIKNREQSLLTRLVNEMGVPVDASHYWNQIQGKINPGFRISYDRSHATMS